MTARTDGAPQVPALPYKYRSFAQPYHLAIFDDRRIYCSQVAEFNDPFEWSLEIDDSITPEEAEEQVKRLVGRKWKRVARSVSEAEQIFRSGVLDDAGKVRPETVAGMIHVVENLRAKHTQSRVYCLSEIADDVLMWSHYGDHHRGFCLGFDARQFPFRYAWLVSYAHSVPRVRVGDLARRGTTPEDTLIRYLATKSAHWSYEREWRVIEGRKRWLTFDAGALREVILGCKVSPESAEAIAAKLARPRWRHVRLRRAMLDRATYSVRITD